MPRKVAIRRFDVPKSYHAIARLENMIKQDWLDIWKEHIDDLQDMAEHIEEQARELAPVYVGNEFGKFDPKVIPGMLRDSISVRVSKSYRYPGIIASASARNVGKHFDYALVQEEKNFHHDIGQARYLSQPFYDTIDEYLYGYGVSRKMPILITRYIEAARGGD